MRVRAARLLGAVGVVVLVALVPPASASARHPPRPRLIGARLVTGSDERPEVALRWSQAVRIVHPSGIRFLAVSRTSQGGRLLTRGQGRVQSFLLGSDDPFVAVQAASGAARGRGGRSRRGRVTIDGGSRRPSPATSEAGAAPGPSGAAVSLPSQLPPSSSDFIASVGINIHANYLDTTYGDSLAVENELVKLGAHYVRDGACVSCTEQRQTLLNLAAAGIKTDYIMGRPGGSESLASLVDMLDGPMNATVASVEGPNEYDAAGDANWAAKLRAYQQELYQRVKASPHLAGVPVLGPSMSEPQDYAPLGSLSSWLDEGNVHPYPSDHVPDTTLDPWEQGERSVGGAAPVAATEAGYHNAVSETGFTIHPVSETAAAAYVPRLALDFFNAGVVRTYLYELIDEHPDPFASNPQDDFGLLRSDYSEKPAYQTLRRLLGAVAPTQAQPFARAAPDYWTANGPDLRDLLFQRGPGSYALVLWRNVSVWNPAVRQDIEVPPAQVTVTLGPDIASVIEQPIDGSPPSPIQRAGANEPITLSLSGMPVVLELTRTG